MRKIILTIASTLLALSLNATVQADAMGVETHSSTKSFNGVYEQLIKSIKANKMGLVAQACAHCGANSIGKKISGNRVVMVFNPKFAVRMLNANVAAGIEAPLRIYLTEQSDGSTMLSYPKPSDVFAPYNTPGLNVMAKELDVILARITTQAVR